MSLYIFLKRKDIRFTRIITDVEFESDDGRNLKGIIAFWVFSTHEEARVSVPRAELSYFNGDLSDKKLFKPLKGKK